MDYKTLRPGSWAWAVEQMFFERAVRREDWPSEKPAARTPQDVDPADTNYADWEIVK